MDNERETPNIPGGGFVSFGKAMSSTADHSRAQEIWTEEVVVLLIKFVTTRDFDFYEFARCISLIIYVRAR